MAVIELKRAFIGSSNECSPGLVGKYIIKEICDVDADAIVVQWDPIKTPEQNHKAIAECDLLIIVPPSRCAIEDAYADGTYVDVGKGVSLMISTAISNKVPICVQTGVDNGYFELFGPILGLTPIPGMSRYHDSWKSCVRLVVGEVQTLESTIKTVQEQLNSAENHDNRCLNSVRQENISFGVNPGIGFPIPAINNGYFDDDEDPHYSIYDPAYFGNFEEALNGKQPVAEAKKEDLSVKYGDGIFDQMKNAEHFVIGDTIRMATPMLAVKFLKG